MLAIWNGTTIADSDETIVVEGNHYFPAESVKADYLVDSQTQSTCPWKGEASYRTLKIGDETNPDAVWFYPQPKDAAAQIKGHYAFGGGVEVVES